MAAPHQATVVSDRLQWRYAPLDAEVVCASAALEAIRREAVEGLSRFSHGGLETGGILLGKRTDHGIEVVGALPIECEHKLGPLFILSGTDEKSLDAALASDRLLGLKPVGLYVSHSRRGFSVAETDAKILERLVPGTWHLVIIVVPAKTGHARAGFFLRGPVAGPFICAHEVSLSPYGRRFDPAPATLPIAPPALVPDPLPVPDLPLPKSPETRLQRAHSVLLREYKRWQLRQWSLRSTLALLLISVAAGGFLVRGWSGSTPAVPIHVTDQGSKLRIEWDPRQKAVRAASGAALEVRDGGRSPVTIPISRSGLNSGGALYVPESDNVEVRLKLMQGKRTESESVIYFINPSRPPTTPVATVPAGSPASPNLPAAPPAGTTASVLAPVPAPLEPSTHRKPAPKVFQMPETRPAMDTAPRAVVNLPEAPDIHAIPASSPITLTGNSPSLMALIPLPAGSVGPPQIRSGHLIWTGSLRKNAVLSFTADGASTGVLNGRLPGVPVKISLHPAELTDGGIAVYSRDAGRPSAVEQPSNWNGWNVVVYHDWDPKKIAEAEVIEAPGPANNWRRLVVRNGNRHASVLVVDWQR